MPTLFDLRKLLGPDGKPICGPTGLKICTPCPRTACCDPPPCLRVTLDYRLSDADIFICVEGPLSPPDEDYNCYQAYPDMQYGLSGRYLTIDTLVPFVGDGGPFPGTDFNYYVEWEVNAPDIYSPADMAARGAHPNSYFSTYLSGVDFYVMRASVQVYCEPDAGDPSQGRYTLDVHYHCRRLTFSTPGDPLNEAEAFITARSKYNWGPAPRCEPFMWQQYGDNDPVEEGYNCSEGGKGRTIPQASAIGSFRPFIPALGRYLDQTFPCADGNPITVQDWSCDDHLPPVGIGHIDPVPTPAPWQLECCQGRTQYASSIPASIVGADSGPPFTPGCSCLTGDWAFSFQADVNYRNWIGSTKPGYQGSFGLGACFGDYNVVTVLVYCLDGFSWAVIAKFNAPLAFGLPDIDVGTILQVAPCTPPNRDNYFEVVLIMNPGTSCAGGCPCYGGALIIANG